MRKEWQHAIKTRTEDRQCPCATTPKKDMADL